MVHLRTVLTISLAGSAIAGAAASPAGATGSVTYERPCVGEGWGVVESGTGFTPGAEIADFLNITSEDGSESRGVLEAPIVTADADGAFTRMLRAPALVDDSDLREQILVTSTDQSDPQLVTSQWTLSAWFASASAWRKGKADPDAKVTIATAGWAGAGVRGTLYLHYLRNGKETARQVLGHPRGDCGDLVKRVTQFPKGRAKAGKYKIYLNDQATLDLDQDAWIGFKVTVPAAKATLR